MGHSRTPTQNTAGDGFPADPIDGYRVPAKSADAGQPAECPVWGTTSGIAADKNWYSRERVSQEPAG
jgi:hypothetical protein